MLYFLCIVFHIGKIWVTKAYFLEMWVMSRFSRLRCHKGFTLVEMVLVLALVAILAALAIPTFSNYRQNMRRKEGIAAAYTILTAAKTYYYRNNDSFSNSTCDCAANNIWLKTADICSNWGIATTPGGQTLTIVLTGSGDYTGITVTLVYNATTGATTIS